jgi:CRP/FNR family transcriptional regulator, cyclic AMP receptor protein
MSLKEEVELLQRIPFFTHIEPAKLKLLAFTSERVGFDPGQILFKQGDMGDAAYIIIEGEADVLVDTAGGQAVVATLGKNAFVGEIAILCDVPRTATVRAKGRVVALRIAKELFMRLVTEFPQMAIAIMRELAHRLELTNQRLREALSRSA